MTEREGAKAESIIASALNFLGSDPATGRPG
jgi:hypothetical protein